MEKSRWILIDTGCDYCGVDIVGGFRTKEQADAFAGLFNRRMGSKRLDILGADCDMNHVFIVREMLGDQHLNPKYG